MPPQLRVTVWDKDFNKADDPIARATVILGEGLEGTMSLPVPGVEGNDDVQQVRDRLRVRLGLGLGLGLP